MLLCSYFLFWFNLHQAMEVKTLQIEDDNFQRYFILYYATQHYYKLEPPQFSTISCFHSFGTQSTLQITSFAFLSQITFLIITYPLEFPLNSGTDGQLNHSVTITHN